MWTTLRDTVSQFVEDECSRMAAALAYYAIYALPAMLVIIVSVAALFVDRGDVTDRLLEHVEDAVGAAGTGMVEVILRQAQEPAGGGWRWLISIGVLVFAATGMLHELQTALNRAWGVEPDPQVSSIRVFLVKRLMSLALLLGITLLLVVSLALSWFLGKFGQRFEEIAPGWFSSNVMWAANELITFTIFTLLFAAIFKFMPDAQIAWSDVWIGAVVTGVLFMAGKFAISLYFAWSAPMTAYGAAGSLALLLLWVYYSGLILFLGAEFTQVVARQRGHRIVPAHGAGPARARGTNKQDQRERQAA